MKTKQKTIRYKNGIAVCPFCKLKAQEPDILDPPTWEEAYPCNHAKDIIIDKIGQKITFKKIVK